MAAAASPATARLSASTVRELCPGGRQTCAAAVAELVGWRRVGSGPSHGETVARQHQRGVVPGGPVRPGGTLRPRTSNPFGNVARRISCCIRAARLAPHGGQAAEALGQILFARLYLSDDPRATSYGTHPGR